MFENSISSEEPRQRPVKKDAHADEVAKQHNLYTDDKSTMWGKERVYYADYQQKSVVMRAQENRITTKLDDHQTVSAMLDLAESRGWDRISLKGSDSFRREAWVQAQARGDCNERVQAKRHRHAGSSSPAGRHKPRGARRQESDSSTASSASQKQIHPRCEATAGAGKGRLGYCRGIRQASAIG